MLIELNLIRHAGLDKRGSCVNNCCPQLRCPDMSDNTADILIYFVYFVQGLSMTFYMKLHGQTRV